jgi:DNA-binding CsgD family transcriptional regulator
VDGDGYAFRHALIREAVQQDLLPGERIELHTRYGDALEGDEDALLELAHHRYAAQDRRRALVAACRAADHARRSLAYAEQLRMLRRVLELWDTVPDAATWAGTDRTAVLELAVEAADRAGEHETGEALATAALAALDAQAEPARAARLLHRRSGMRWQLSRENDLTDLREAVRLAPAGQPVRAVVLAALASRLMMIPRHEEARAAAEEALAAARLTGDAAAETAALIHLATLAARRGDFGQLDHIAAAAAVAESTGADATLMLALHWQSHILVAYGEGPRAMQVARRGISVASRAGLARTSGALHAVDLVDALIALGRWDEALEVIEHTLELAPTPDLRAHLLRGRGVVALARGDLALPEVAVRETWDLMAARDTQDANQTLPTAGLEIELLLAQDRPADALVVAERVLADYDLQGSSRFSWPLLAIGTRAAQAAGTQTERAAALLSGLRAEAGKLPVSTPVQMAHSLTFAAESARAEGVTDRAGWDAVAAAWHDLAEPYPEASALRYAAEAAAVEGDRDAAAGRLRRAAELADRLDAHPLRERIDRLARRARILLWPAAELPSDDPAEQARRRLGLTPRELEVLRLVADGRNNRDIAQELFISAKTASVHVSNILAKLGVATRVEAAATAHRLHLFEAGS